MIQLISRPWAPAPLDREAAAELARVLEVPFAVAALLWQRGLRSEAEAQSFLRPSLLDLHPPETIPDLQWAVDLVFEAVREKREICIYGDYDVDGISGTTILVEALRELGVKARTYIPHRLNEGYGLNCDAVRRLHAEGVRLLITVDGGANNVEELELAVSLGLDVIVTDHHPYERNTLQVPIVHPGRSDQPSPSRDLCGAGVAYKFAWALGKRDAGADRVAPRFRSFLEEALCLAALGTVADVVPLIGENRAIVTHGLRALGRTSRPGLKALLEVCALTPHRLEASDIGFRIAPHINAAGRMGEAEQALELLLTRDEDRGRILASSLASLNRRRKAIETAMVDECLAEIEESPDSSPGRGPRLFAREGWHSGVAGIVAARLVDRLDRPVFVIALEDEIGRGSARSIPEYPLTDVYDALRECTRSVGGHACAGGVTIDSQRLEEFRTALESANVGSGAETLPPRLYDFAIDGSEATLELARAIQMLAPFGEGNREPVFRVDRLSLDRSPRLVGRHEDHLLLRLRHSEGAFDSIGFRQASLAGEFAQSKGAFSIVSELSEDRYRGVARLRARLIDLLRHRPELSSEPVSDE